VRHVVSLLQPFVTEKELAWEFEKYCRERGAERMAFNPIIAFGENTSFPHHSTSDRPWKEREPVMIDVGCVLNSYASDVTRTLWSSDVAPPYARLLEIVQSAQKAALALCKPNTRIGDLDAAARQVMRQEGVEELYLHSLGHGIGLETHEFPRVSIKADERDTPLEEGMVITIEPGLYVAGVCGARHEDTIIVTQDR
jgi:Xaa-Pro aminopeptidase